GKSCNGTRASCWGHARKRWPGWKYCNRSAFPPVVGLRKLATRPRRVNASLRCFTDRGFRSDDLHVCRHDFSKLHPDPRPLLLFLFDPGEFIMFKLMGKLR